MFTYCGNNPANYIDYFGNRLSHFSYVAWDGCLSAGSNEDGNEEDQSFYYTGSVGLTGSYCINGIFYFGQVSMVTDAFGNSEIQFSYGSGFTTGDAGGSLMLNMAFTNAPTAQHLHGMGYALGGTYSNAAFDLMFVPDSNANNTYWGFSFSGGFGSAEAHASMSNTVYAIPIDFNLFEFADLVYKSYWGIYE